MVHVLRARARLSAPATRTAISPSGRWWRWLSISSPRAMPAFSKRRYRSSTIRARTRASARQSGSTSSALWPHRQRRIPGTTLAAYGHGDWNDSLQPADPALRDHMCSAWTVTLHFQALMTLARALRSIGRAAQAEPLERQADGCSRRLSASPASGRGPYGLRRVRRRHGHPLPAASAGCDDRRPLQLSRDDPCDPRGPADSGSDTRAPRDHRGATSPVLTARACSTLRCPITAARSASSSARRARRSSAARSA